MVQMVCPCLNIRVHSKDAEPQLKEPSTLGISVDALSDNFFRSEVYDVILDLGGVTKAQKALCNSRCVDGWIITSCAGCDVDVYAKHTDDSDRVLVSTVVEKEATRISSLLESDHYSCLFKLLLPEINSNFIHNNLGIELSNNGSLEQSIEHVQHQVSNYLKEEQKAMEERIRQFTEQQQLKFNALQQKVRKHKQAMVYLVLKANKNKRPESGEPMFESPLSSPVSPMHQMGDDSSSSTDSAITRSEPSENPIKPKAPTQKPMKIFRRSMSNPPHTKTKESQKMKYSMHSLDVGGVFDMEAYDIQMEPAFTPYCDSEDDTDVSEGSAVDDSIPTKDEDATHTFATSLPVSVPSFSNYSRISHADDEKIPSPEHPEEIAESMRALAQSVRDGTEMFGDLPRQRLNTGDLIRSRLF